MQTNHEDTLTKDNPVVDVNSCMMLKTLAPTASDFLQQKCGMH